jgi:hypothetical protein
MEVPSFFGDKYEAGYMSHDQEFKAREPCLEKYTQHFPFSRNETLRS